MMIYYDYILLTVAGKFKFVIVPEGMGGGMYVLLLP